MKRAGLVCSGNIVADLLVRPVDEFRWGASVWVEDMARSLGGNGANTSYAAALCGARVRLWGMVGADEAGAYALAQLEAAGVDTRAVIRSPSHPTAASVVLVQTNGERMFLHRPGASLAVFAEPLSFAGLPEEGFSHYHLASPFALPLQRPHAAENLRRARAAGLTTSVDAQWDSRGRWMEDFAALLPHTDYLFLNQEEAERLAGTGDPPAAAARLRQAGARSVILKLGARGCRVFGPGVEFAQPSFQVTVVDTTGAGDCFVGAFLAATQQGASLAAAARQACAVAALTVRAMGAVTGLPGRERLPEALAKLQPRTP